MRENKDNPGTLYTWTGEGWVFPPFAAFIPFSPTLFLHSVVLSFCVCSATIHVFRFLPEFEVVGVALFLQVAAFDGGPGWRSRVVLSVQSAYWQSEARAAISPKPMSTQSRPEDAQFPHARRINQHGAGFKQDELAAVVVWVPFARCAGRSGSHRRPSPRGELTSAVLPTPEEPSRQQVFPLEQGRPGFSRPALVGELRAMIRDVVTEAMIAARVWCPRRSVDPFWSRG